MAESSFYYWQKKLRAQELLDPQTMVQPTRVEDHDRPAYAEDHAVDAEV